MRIASLLIVSILAVGVSSATVLTANNPCVGVCQGMTSAGAIEVFTGNPGTFLDSASMRISIGPATPLGLNLEGTLISAVFRDPSGQLGFYYQVTGADFSCVSVRLRFHQSHHKQQCLSFSAECGRKK